MQRTTLIALLAVIGGAVFFAVRPDGVGAGAFAGTLLGGAVALLSHSLVRLSLQHNTQAAFQALTVGFGVKFLGAALPCLALYFLPESVLPLRADGTAMISATAYLLVYAAVVVLVLGTGVADNLRLSNDVALDAMSARDGDAQGVATNPGSHPVESAS